MGIGFRRERRTENLCLPIEIRKQAPEFFSNPRVTKDQNCLGLFRQDRQWPFSRPFAIAQRQQRITLPLSESSCQSQKNFAPSARRGVLMGDEYTVKTELAQQLRSSGIPWAKIGEDNLRTGE